MLAKIFNIYGDIYFLQNATAQTSTKKTIVTRHHVNTVQYPKSGKFQDADLRLELKFSNVQHMQHFMKKNLKTTIQGCNCDCRVFLTIKCQPGCRLRRPSLDSSATGGCLDCLPWRAPAGCRCTAPVPLSSCPCPTAACPVWAPERWAQPESAGNTALWRRHHWPAKRRTSIDYRHCSGNKSGTGVHKRQS